MKKVLLTLAAIACTLTLPFYHASSQGLSVSPFSGGPTFSYPISVQTVNGHTIAVELRWVPNVTQVYLKEFKRIQDATNYPSTSYTPWHYEKFSRRHGVWMITVNGICVQTLSAPYRVEESTPSVLGPGEDAVNDNSTVEIDNHWVPWLIEGYDYSNTVNFLDQDDNIQDKITIMTSSGSAIELLNQYRHGDISTLSLNTEDAYTGEYYVQGVNQVGHAVVEFDDRYYPDELREHIDDAKHADAKPLDQWRPRLVRYYPGDGLEYVFREHPAPYGRIDQTHGAPLDYTPQTDQTWKDKVGPKTMYLDSIVKDGQPIAIMDWAKHKPDSAHADFTRTRALFQGLNGLRISYGRNLITVESNGNTHQLILDALMGMTDPPSGSSVYSYDTDPVASLFNSLTINGDLLRTQFTNYEVYYKSYQNVIREILGPGNTRLEFEYARRYGGADNGTDEITFDAFVLHSIESTTGRHELVYKDEANQIYDDTDIEDVAEGKYNDNYSNIVDTLKTLLPNGTLLSTVDFSYDNTASTIETVNYDVSSTITTTFFESDGTTIDHASETTNYLDYIAIDPLYEVTDPYIATSKIYHADLVHSATTVKDWDATASALKAKMSTKVKVAPAPPPTESDLIRLPRSVETWITHGDPSTSPPTLQLGRTEYGYTFETLTDAFSVTGVRDMFRTLVATDTVEVLQPNGSPTGLLARSITTYSNLPCSTYASVSIKDTTVDDYWSVRNQKEEFYGNGIISDIEYLTETSATSRDIHANPIWGLVSEVERYDSLGIYVGGTQVEFQETYTGSAGIGISVPRGAVKSVDILGLSTNSSKANAPVISDVVELEYQSGGYFRTGLETVTDVRGGVTELDYGNATVSGSRQATAGATMGSLDIQNLDYTRTRPYSVTGVNRYFDPFNSLSPGTEQLREITSYQTSTPDGISSYSVNNDGVLSTSRRHVDSIDTHVWTYGSYPTDWRRTGHTIPIWHSKTTVDATRTVTDCDGTSNPSTTDVDQTIYERLFLMHGRKVKESQTCYDYDNDGNDERHYETWTSKIEMKYIASDDDVLQSESAVDVAFLRLYVVDIFDADVLGLVDFDVTFTVGGQVYTEYLIGDITETDSRNTDETVYSQIDIELDTALVSTMKGMSDGQEMTITIELADSSQVDEAFIEFACHATDAMPTLWCFAQGVGGVHELVDASLDDFTAKTDVDINTLESRTLLKLDDSSSTGGSTFTASNSNLADGRYLAGISRATPNDLKVASGVVDGDPFDGVSNDESETVSRSDGSLAQLSVPSGTSASPTMATTTFSNTPADSSFLIHPGTSSDSIQSKDTIDVPSRFGFTGAAADPFYGLCRKSTTFDEEGHYVRTYSNALGQVLHSYVQVDNDSLSDLHTEYQYDHRQRLVKVVNPIGQEISYSYDDFGRVVSITHPDIGITTYAYDQGGMVRFVQTAQQAIDNYVTYYQYDDFGRLCVTGEARLDSGVVFADLDPDVINDDFATRNPAVTITGNVSPSMWTAFVPASEPEMDLSDPIDFDDCPPERPEFAPPFDVLQSMQGLTLLERPAKVYPHPAHNSLTDATKNDFEDLYLHPSFGRVVTAWDDLPLPGVGLTPTWYSTIWKQLPSRTTLGNMMPTGQVRNTEGRVAAVAYRDHGSHPWWFKVYSYDERGRLEAILRVNENLPYDATYYKYDDAGNITVVSSVDPVRNHRTWYTYDDQGRLESMSAALSQEGATYGLGLDALSTTTGNGYANITWVTRPTAEDVEFEYDRQDRITTKTYNNVDGAGRELQSTRVYDQDRGSVTDHQLEQTSAPTAKIYLEDTFSRDKTQRVTEHTLQNNTYTTGKVKQFRYDNAGRLIKNDTATTTPSREWELNKNSGRIQAKESNGSIVAGYNYPAGNGTNEVTSVVSNGVTPDEPVVTQTYDADGRLVSRAINDASLTAPHASEMPTEALHWSYANRLLALETDFTSLAAGCLPPIQPWPETYRQDSLEWTYRYSPSGLREQKRLMRAPTHDSADCEAVFPWTYYVRSPSGTELVVYQGRQVAHLDAPVGCQGPGYGKIVNNVTQRLVYLYPVEYRSYGPDGVQLMWVRDPNTGAMIKKFVETDDRGSIAGLHDALDSQTDYHPFGYPIDVNGNYDGNWINRTGWLDRETDYESAVGNPSLSYIDVNARKYIPRHGRFVTPDEMWGIDVARDPYSYSMHDPVNLADESGYYYTGPSWSTPMLYEGPFGQGSEGGGYFETEYRWSLIYNDGATIGYDLYRLIGWSRFVHNAGSGFSFGNMYAGPLSSWYIGGWGKCRSRFGCLKYAYL